MFRIIINYYRTLLKWLVSYNVDPSLISLSRASTVSGLVDQGPLLIKNRIKDKVTLDSASPTPDIHPLDSPPPFISNGIYDGLRGYLEGGQVWKEF